MNLRVRRSSALIDRLSGATREIDEALAARSGELTTSFDSRARALDDALLDRSDALIGKLSQTTREIDETILARSGELTDKLSGKAREINDTLGARAEEIAGALLYLVSPAAGFVTGESIAVDGGLLCRV